MRANESQKENCICCGDETDIDKSTPIEQRLYYVQGQGQLCEKCYNNLYLDGGPDFI